MSLGPLDSLLTVASWQQYNISSLLNNGWPTVYGPATVAYQETVEGKKKKKEKKNVKKFWFQGTSHRAFDCLATLGGLRRENELKRHGSQIQQRILDSA